MTSSRTTRNTPRTPARTSRVQRALVVVLAVLLVAVPLAFVIAFVSIHPDFEVATTTAGDPTLPRLEIDGYPFHAETHGDPADPVILVLHGGPGGDYRSLLPLRDLSTAGYHVVFYDQRGTGLSPRGVPAERLTLQATVDDLDAIVDRVSPGRPVALLGHSWGAMIAAYYLDAHPEKAARAILVEPGVLTSAELREFVSWVRPPMTTPVVLHLGRAFIASLHLDGPDEDAQIDYIVQSAMGAPLAENPLRAYWCGGTPPEGADEFWRVGGHAQEAILADARQPDGELAMPPLDHLHTWPGEVLLVASSCNTRIGAAQQEAHLPLFGRARLVVVQDAGHAMHLDQPEVFRKLVLDYLATPGWGRPQAAAP